MNRKGIYLAGTAIVIVVFALVWGGLRLSVGENHQKVEAHENVENTNEIEVLPESEPDVLPEPEPEPEVSPDPAPEPNTEVLPDPEPEPEPEVLPEPEPEPEILPEPEPEVDFVIANVDSYLNVRQEPSTEARILGKLYRGAKATILERDTDWTKITSGSVTGYVANDYLMFDEDALLGAEEYGVKWVTVDTDTLRVRKRPSADAKVLDLVGRGSRLLGVLDMEDTDGWVAIDYSDDEIGYVSAEFVTVTFELEEAISIEEEQRRLEEQRLAEQRAAQAAAAAKAQQEAKKTTVATANREAFRLSDEDVYLLAGVVHMEAGNQSYEGKLAVANVVLNRLKSGKWGNTMKSVVYAKGQFTGANTGMLQRFLDQGPNAGSMKAAAEAVAGVNNIGDYLAFCANRAAKYDTYKSYTIIDGHTFYKR